jgi:uncharacterized protein
LCVEKIRLRFNSIRKMQPPLWCIAPSPIHGMGLFATRDIRANRRLGEYTGRRMSRAEAAEKHNIDNVYLMHNLVEDNIVDGSDLSNEMRWVNASVTPNSMAVNLADGRIVFKSKRKIRRHEEITVDYGRAYYKAFKILHDFDAKEEENKKDNDKK